MLGRPRTTPYGSDFQDNRTQLPTHIEKWLCTNMLGQVICETDDALHGWKRSLSVALLGVAVIRDMMSLIRLLIESCSPSVLTRYMIELVDWCSEVARTFHDRHKHLSERIHSLPASIMLFVRLPVACLSTSVIGNCAPSAHKHKSAFSSFLPSIFGSLKPGLVLGIAVAPRVSKSPCKA